MLSLHIAEVNLWELGKDLFHVKWKKAPVVTFTPIFDEADLSVSELIVIEGFRGSWATGGTDSPFRMAEQCLTSAFVTPAMA